MKKFFMIGGLALIPVLFVLGMTGADVPFLSNEDPADRALAMAQDAQILTSVASNTDPLSDRVRRKVQEDMIARDNRR